MKLVFLSNFINHHQIPMCERLFELLGDGFHFLQSMPMESERIEMGWNRDVDRPWLVRLYEDESRGTELIDGADAVLLGWSERPDLDKRRLMSRKATMRMSEPVYKNGRWRFISPRGLIHKYDEHIRYRNDPVPMLCAGAYAAYDFSLMRAYPGKLFKWGYFPPLRGGAPAEKEETSLVWAGRFIDWKHPDFAVRAAASLMKKGFSFTLFMVGGGPMEAGLKGLAADLGVADKIVFTGYRTPDETRDIMDRCAALLMTSDLMEGWGAVVNEGMDSGCCVVGSYEAGSVPFLIRDKENGRVYRRGSYTEFERVLTETLSDPEGMRKMGEAARETVSAEWNGRIAADRLCEFSSALISGEIKAFEKGILSRAEVIRPE